MFAGCRDRYGEHSADEESTDDSDWWVSSTRYDHSTLESNSTVLGSVVAAVLISRNLKQNVVAETNIINCVAWT